MSVPRFEAVSISGGPVDEAARRALLAELPPISQAVTRATISITFLAGAGTRWKASLVEAKRRFEENGAGLPEVAGFPVDAPRGLFPVPDFLSGLFPYTTLFR